MIRKTRGPRFSEGARRLIQKISKKKLTFKEAAEQIVLRNGTVANRASVHHWAFGDRSPSRRFATAILNAFGIPTESWDEAPRSPRKHTKKGSQ